MIEFNNVEHGYAIADLAGTSFNPDVDVVISRSEEGELWGGSIYTSYTGASVAVHIAGFRSDWINKDMLWVGFDYPFNQLGCSKLFGQVPETNIKALEFDLKIGFKIVARIADVFPDGDLFIVCMDRAECRWLKLKPRSLTVGKEI